MIVKYAGVGSCKRCFHLLLVMRNPKTWEIFMLTLGRGVLLVQQLYDEITIMMSLSYVNSACLLPLDCELYESVQSAL